MASSSSNSSGSSLILGSTGGGSIGILMYQSTSALLYHGKSTSSGSLGDKHFQPSFDISGELHISSCWISYPSSVQDFSITFHKSMQTSNSSCTMLDRGSLASHCSGHMEDFPHWGPIVKDLVMDLDDLRFSETENNFLVDKYFLFQRILNHLNVFIAE